MGSTRKEIRRFNIKIFMSIKNIIIRLADKVPFGIRDKIRKVPLLKQLQFFLLKKWVNEESFVATISGGPAKGLVFPVQMPQDKLMWIGTFELEYAKALQQAIRKDWVCYDIGGYKGYYAGIMAISGAAEVYVFEPMPANAKKIELLLALNPHLPIHLKKYAVSDNTGNAIFRLMPEVTMGKLESSSFQPEDKEIEQISVDTITLDELIRRGTPEPDFIKIDVEGAEEFVLRGAIELLQRKKPLLMIEVHSPEIGKRCLNVLKKYYPKISVLETGELPEKGTPEICHYIVSN